MRLLLTVIVLIVSLPFVALGLVVGLLWDASRFGIRAFNKALGKIPRASREGIQAAPEPLPLDGDFGN
jgi:hypothetical protein